MTGMMLWAIVIILSLRLDRSCSFIPVTKEAGFRHLQPSVCSENQDSPIDGSILVTYLGQPAFLNSPEIAQLEQSVREVYNRLVLRNDDDCTAGFRNITMVELRMMSLDRSGTVTSDPIEFEVQYRIRGVCRHCAGSLLFFTSSDNSTLLCNCRPPLVARYELALQNNLEALRSNRSVINVLDVEGVTEVIPVDCEVNLTSFTASAVVDFVVSSPEEVNVDTLAASFLTTYNDLNGLNSLTCDMSFRRIVGITPSLDTNLGRSIGGSSSSSSQTITVTNALSVRFDILARCRGCDASDTTLFERESVIAEVFRGRKLMDESGSRRLLQDDDGTRNECRCPVSPELRGRSEDEFITSFNGSLSDLFSRLSVIDVIEIAPVSCNSTIESFNSTVTVDLNLTSDIETDDLVLDDDSINNITFGFLTSYNNLAQRFCDPFFRAINSVVFESSQSSLVRQRRLQTTNVTFSYTFSTQLFIGGSCRGCSQDTGIFDDGFRRRRLSEREGGGGRKRRGRWLQDDECYCSAVTVVDGAPTERDFLIQFGQDLDDIAGMNMLRGFQSLSGLQMMGPSPVGPPPMRNECMVDDDCRRSRQGDICVFNQCLFVGNPRFTLTWVGNDDYDLSVVTPTGVNIFFGFSFDQASRGVFDTGFVQSVNGSHVESVYFPRSGSAPSGFYNVTVTQFRRRGASDDWTLNVYGSMSSLEATFTGSGDSNGISYFFGSMRPEQRDCVVNNATQCCEDRDCRNRDLGDFCAGEQCISEGNPRFTLTYFGDNELELSVVTPDGETISSGNRFDDASQGLFEPDRNEGLDGFHTQNIIFPRNGSSPNGEYVYFVSLLSSSSGGALDSWDLELSDRGEIIAEQSGTGSSDFFFFIKSPNVDGLLPNGGRCAVRDVIECCSEIDCDESEICVSFRCISPGTPRFTLIWLGADDLDIYVELPSGTRIFWENPTDAATGGVLLEDINPISSVIHVESISFPLNGSSAPLGRYFYGVDLWDQRGSTPDQWNLTVSLGGVEVSSVQGTGSSELFTFDYNEVVTFAPDAFRPPRPPSESMPPRPPSESMPPRPPSESMPPRPPSESMPPRPPSESMPPRPPSESMPPRPPSESMPPGSMSGSDDMRFGDRAGMKMGFSLRPNRPPGTGPPPPPPPRP